MTIKIGQLYKIIKQPFLFMYEEKDLFAIYVLPDEILLCVKTNTSNGNCYLYKNKIIADSAYSYGSPTNCFEELNV